MKPRHPLLLALLLLASAGTAAEPDPRVQAGTSSLEAAVLTLEANKSRQAGRPDAARQQFADALAKDPQALLARLSLGDLNLAEGRAEEAEKLWRALVEEGDRDPRLPHRLRATAAVRLGKLLKNQGRDQAALYFFSKPPAWEQTGNTGSTAYYGIFEGAWGDMQEIYSRAKAPGYGSMYPSLDKYSDNIEAEINGARTARYRQPHLNLGLLELEETAPLPAVPAPVSWEGRVSPEDLEGVIHLPTGQCRLAAELNGPAVWILPLRAAAGKSGSKHPGPVRLDCASGKRVTLAPSGSPVLAACGMAEGMLLGRQGGRADLVDASGKVLRSMETFVNSPAQLLHCPRTGRLFGVDADNDTLRHIRLKREPGPVMLPMGAAGGACVLDPERGILYSMVKRHPRVSQHAVLQVADRCLPAWWLPFRNGPSLVALSIGREGVLFPLSLRALPTLAPGGTLSLSSDGEELTVAGGGGSPLFDGTEVRARREARSYFRRHFIDLPAAYPAGRPDLPALGAWHHPFAPVVAVLDAEGVSFHPRGGSAEAARFAGTYLPEGAWTADGTAFLLLRRPPAETPAVDATPVAFRVTLRPEDLAAGKARQEQKAAWAAALAAKKESEAAAAPVADPKPGAVVSPAAAATSAAPAAPTPRDFPVTTNLVEAVAALQAALAAPGDHLSPDWRGADGYGRAPVHPQFKDILDVAQVTRPGDEPFGLVRAKKWFAEGKPPYAPAHFVRGTLRVAPAQREAAIADFLEAARLDGATTSLSRLSLLEAARRSARDNQDARALSCYAAALSLDAPSSELIKEMEPLLARHGVKAGGRAADLAARAQSKPETRPRVALRLPPPTPAPAVAPTPGDLHARAQRATATGWVEKTPFCAVLIDEAGHLLTALDDLPKTGGVDLTFAPAGGARPAPPLRAEILRRDVRTNLALLRVAAPPPGAAPLELADTIPPVGTRVHALSGADPRPDATQPPGLSAGIISGPMRRVNGEEMLQHSAAVNRHGIGGPVLDPAGKLVGLSARDSHLENVAFALPATRLRAWLSDISTEEMP